MARQIKAKIDSTAFRRNNGKVENILTLVTQDNIGPLYEELQGRELSVELKPYREKRSKNANAFMWELCGRIADATRLGAVEIYRSEVQQMGIYKDICFHKDSDGRTMATIWNARGIGWMAERLDYEPDGEGATYRFWYGSSVYNTEQMARLIDNLVQDCEALGIDCSTEQERSLLLQNWEGEKADA